MGLEEFKKYCDENIPEWSVIMIAIRLSGYGSLDVWYNRARFISYCSDIETHELTNCYENGTPYIKDMNKELLDDYVSIYKYFKKIQKVNMRKDKMMKDFI